MEEADNNEIEGDVGDMGTQSNAEDTKSEGDSSANELPIEIAVGGEKVSTKANTSEDVQEFWVQIRNLPPSMRQKNIKAFLMSRLGTHEVNRIRVKKDTIFFTLPSQEEASRAVKVLNGISAKGQTLEVSAADSSFRKPRELPVLATGMGFKTFPRRRPLLGAQHPGGPVLRSHYPVGPRITPRYPDMAPRYPGVIPPPCAGVPSMASHRPGRPLLGPPCSRPMPLRPTINQKPRSESDKLVVRSGEEPVTPLAHMEYSEQLKRKTDNAVELINAVLRQMAPAGVKNARDMTASDILQPIRYSSKTSACYNKCEFTVGRNPEGKITVGFVGKRPSAANTFIVSVETYTHISEHMKRVVNAFQKFVVESGEEPFNELERTGVWKSLMVRECSGDVLIMASILAMKNSEREEELKKSFAERFLRSSNLSDKENRFRITSIYWERIADAGENSIREHIGGTPYIYETINGTRFRILPETYFPTNSHAAAVFFSTIAEKAGIVDAIGRSRKQTMNGSPNANVVSMEEVMLEDEKGGDSKRADEIEDEKMDAGSIESSSEAALIAEDEGSGTTEDSESTREQMMEDKESNAAKKRKIDAESVSDRTMLADASASKGTVIVNVGRGMGNIGLYLMCLLRKSKRAAGRRFLFGNDLLNEMIEGAKCNALDNAFVEDEFRFVAARMEDVMPTLETYLPSWANMNEANVIGVLDPPRGRINDNVAIACRTLSCMRKLIYVSSEPSLALRNLVDLCKPSWKKYGGEPFKLTSVTPVDMFPHTEHCVWIIELDREDCN